MSENNVVEAAPDVVDLNALLGMTDEEINAVATSDSFTEDEVVIEDTIDEPHITVSTKELLNVLRISAMIVAAGENSFEGKVVVFKIEEDNVRFLLSDNKRNIEKLIPIVNTENKFTGFLAFTTSVLARLIKVCGNGFSIIEREEGEGEDKKKKYLLKITGGEIHLDNIKMNQDKFVKDFSDNFTDYDKATILTSISRLFTFASTSIKTGKNIDFNGNVIQASPINSLAKITSVETYPSFRLSLTDARILYTLLATDEGEKLGINKDGKIFKGDRFSFKTESFQTQNCAFDTVAERMFSSEEYATIDHKHLAQLTELSCGLDTSLGNLEFNYTDEGKVSCKLLTKRDNSNIILQGTTNDSLVPLEKPVEIPATNLKGALSVFSTETTLNMRVTTDGVCFETGNVRVSVLGRNVGK